MKKTLIKVFFAVAIVAVLAVSLGIAASAAGNGTGGNGSGDCTAAGLENKWGQSSSAGQGHNGQGNGSSANGAGQASENKWGQNASAERGHNGECDCTASQGDADPADLTESEIDWLTDMRQEEKLARDVYLAFYDQYEARIFSRIAASEQKHMDAVKNLLDRYRVADPVEGLEPGEFNDPDLEDLYAELVEKGSGSLDEALEAGVEIEEMDIEDLKDALDSTVQTDIQKVYEHLLRGSLNHLKAFTNQLVK
ncbi:MAG: DUF2202 domain-containing protein [Dehalococcoidales bacterium]|nr:DUF2202 domain-containing protein [Dehalococcoidales bacterium]